ncbi:hypothetical protein [Phytoactinopolyspora halotolerans]|uniref:DUF732 domain-containing protein n=1 Tax=Phytoactinopolyspora halotolerans TaxID=1981512 RepID=A0A6L9SK05_9ACTN|nr:hypothetical protein [Phytoactinopolyspora halotolerans]NEE04410.1 hypothetical protein [Phytoactinopolyspora halotolerans]
MGRTLRRALLTSVATVGIVGLAASQASAHFCFRENLNERAQESSASSPAWATFEELAFQFTGLCPAGIEVLADAAGVTTSTLIHTKAVLAGGTLKKGPDGGTPAISHLDIAAIEAAEDDAIAACA